MDKAAWLMQVLGVRVANPRPQPAAADPIGSAAPGGSATPDPTLPDPAPGSAADGNDRVTVTLQIVNQTEIALAYSAARYDPGTVSPQNGLPSGIAAGGTCICPVDFAATDASGNPAERYFYMDFTGTAADGSQLTVETGFVYANGAPVPQFSSTPDGYAGQKSANGNTLTLTVAAAQPPQPAPQPDPPKPPADQLTTVTLQITNQTGIALTYSAARYDPGTVFPQNGLPSGIAAGDTCICPIDFAAKDASGNPVERYFYMDFTGAAADGSQLTVETGFVYANGAPVPQFSSTPDGYAGQKSANGNTLTLTIAAAQPPQPQPQPDPPKPPADQLTTVTLQITNQTDIALTYSAARYDPGTVFPRNGLPSGIAAGDTCICPVDFAAKDTGGNPVERYFYMDFTGTAGDGSQLTVETGFVYADGAPVAQFSSTPDGYAGQKSASADTVTLTVAAPAAASS